VFQDSIIYNIELAKRQTQVKKQNINGRIMSKQNPRKTKQEEIYGLKSKNFIKKPSLEEFWSMLLYSTEKYESCN
jgi:hypothetical protein